jgi:2-iminoacetate synthase
MLDFEKIEELSRTRFRVSEKDLAEILDKAVALKGLTLDDVGKLLSISSAGMLEQMREAAFAIKKKVYGDRIVLFAPLYLSNECANKCLYCGFQTGNTREMRKTLSVDEAVREGNFLAGRGFRRTLLVTAENKAKCGKDYLIEVIEALYKKTPLKIIHLNAAPMEIEDLAEMRKSGIGVYQVFQETYHKETYAKLHTGGKKKDYDYRLSCMDRAIKAGFHDVGIGALLGLYDYKFDVLATIAHAFYLKEKLKTFPHTISVPRFRTAIGARISKAPHFVNDRTFKKIVSVYRLAVPTAGVVVSTREPASLRDEILFHGASQISAESSTAPGGYTGMMEKGEGAQFSLNDTRPLEEIVTAILDKDMFPSFCTACYKKGREGGKFHKLASSGKIKDFCEYNAYTTFLEYISTREDKKLRGSLMKKLNRYMNGRALDAVFGKDAVPGTLR